MWRIEDIGDHPAHWGSGLGAPRSIRDFGCRAVGCRAVGCRPRGGTARGLAGKLDYSGRRRYGGDAGRLDPAPALKSERAASRVGCVSCDPSRVSRDPSRVVHWSLAAGRTRQELAHAGRLIRRNMVASRRSYGVFFVLLLIPVLIAGWTAWPWLDDPADVPTEPPTPRGPQASAPMVTPVAVSHRPPRQSSAAVLAEKQSANSDDWTTEAVAETIDRRLAELAQWMTEGSAEDDRSASWVSEDFACETLVPQRLGRSLSRCGRHCPPLEWSNSEHGCDATGGVRRGSSRPCGR